MGVSKGDEREKKRAENGFEEIIVKNLHILREGTNTQVGEEQRVPNSVNPKRCIPKPVIIRMAKIRAKERILKAAGKKN